MWDFDITNIAGIRHGEATLHPGLNTVQASNFQGKSSFMAAVQTAVGTTGMFGSHHPLTEGADEGTVTLTDSDGTEHKVTLQRENNRITRTGDPYLSDETDRICANLFAFLGEDNPIRAAVRNGEDLTEYLQAPLDIEAINSQIDDLKDQRERLETDIREAENSAEQLPAVQSEITQLEDDLADLRERRDQLADEVPDGTNSSELSDALSTKQGSLSSAESDISRLEGKIERLQDTLEEKQAELDALEVPSEPELNADVSEKEDRINDLELKISLLQDLQRANQQVIDQNEIELVTDINRGIEADTINCWVCGGETTADDIEDRLEGIQEKIKSLRNEKSELEAEVNEIEQAKREIRKKKNQQDELEDSIGSLKVNIEEAKSDLEQAKSRKEDLEAEIADLEAQIEDAEEELNEELTDVKAEISRKESALEDKKAEIETLEAEAEKIDELEDEHDELSDQIAELRQRKVKKQEELESQFNEALGDVIDRFAPGFDGGQLIPKRLTDGEDIDEFELTIVREGRETSLDTLSEGEQELVGIVVAIAGYRTFNVDDRVPAILIDGISQLSSENLQNLLDYLEGASEILVTTAYPEAGDLGGGTVNPSEWDVVSDEDTAAA